MTAIGNLEGLVFAMPLSETTYGFGQIIKQQNPVYYMAAYGLRKSADCVTEAEIEGAEIIALGNFFDVLINTGRWLPVAKFQIPEVPFPCYKIKIGNDLWVENWQRTRSRIAKQDELLKLDFRSNHGPIVLEHAAKHHFGLHSKEDLFTSLKPKHISEIANFV